MTSITTEWRTDDPGVAFILRYINDERDPVVRLELEAMLHQFQANMAIRHAEAIRQSDVRRRAYRRDKPTTEVTS